MDVAHRSKLTYKLASAGTFLTLSALATSDVIGAVTTWRDDVNKCFQTPRPLFSKWVSPETIYSCCTSHSMVTGCHSYTLATVLKGEMGIKYTLRI